MDGRSPIEIVLAVVAVGLTALAWAARRYPEKSWLRHFDFQRGVSAQQQKRFRRTANVTSGLELILLGVVLPIGYFFLEMMTFSQQTKVEIAVVATISLSCIVAGSFAIARSLRS